MTRGEVYLYLFTRAPEAAPSDWKEYLDLPAPLVPVATGVGAKHAPDIELLWVEAGRPHDPARFTTEVEPRVTAFRVAEWAYAQVRAAKAAATACANVAAARAYADKHVDHVCDRLGVE